jgi:hypothetical protein
MSAITTGDLAPLDLGWVRSPIYRLNKDRQVEIYSVPGPSGYQSTQVVPASGQLSLVIGGIQLGTISAADLLPRLRT